MVIYYWIATTLSLLVLCILSKTLLAKFKFGKYQYAICHLTAWTF
jgi:hypothetical protein